MDPLGVGLGFPVAQLLELNARMQTLSSAAIIFPMEKCVGRVKGLCFKGGLLNSTVTLMLTSIMSGDVCTAEAALEGVDVGLCAHTAQTALCGHLWGLWKKVFLHPGRPFLEGDLPLSAMLRVKSSALGSKM